MAQHLRETAGLAVVGIDRALKEYARSRTVSGVGQFLDDEGCTSMQFGLYGMSIWLLFTRAARHDVEVARVQADCLQLLAAAVDGGPLALPKHVEELKAVVPKMAYACAALYTSPSAHGQATALLQRLKTATKKGGWGFSTTGDKPNVMATALVIRLLRGVSGNSFVLEDAVSYLRSELGGIQNPYAKLYVLTSLKRVDEAKVTSSELSAAIAELYLQVAKQPTKFPNPTIVDYQEQARTRYFRIPSDVILVEALAYLGGGWQLYLSAHTGRRVFGYLAAHCAALERFKLDAIGHRPSVGTYMYLRDAMELIKVRQTTEVSLPLARLAGWFAASAKFGLDFTWNLFALLGSGAGTMLLHYYGHTTLRNILAGAFVKSLLDAGRSLWQLRRGA